MKTNAADQESPPQLSLRMTFELKPRSPELPEWEINIYGDHSGSFRELSETAALHSIQMIHVSETGWKKLIAAEPAVKDGHCETKQKGIAQTGEKRLLVSDGRESATCHFNYSDDEALNEAVNEFLALAEMMEQGAKLQHDLRFDRLSLDADMDALLSEARAGRAVEAENIAPVLQAIVDDDHVIDRVRRKAARLLQDASPMADKPR